MLETNTGTGIRLEKLVNCPSKDKNIMVILPLETAEEYNLKPGDKIPVIRIPASLIPEGHRYGLSEDSSAFVVLPTRA